MGRLGIAGNLVWKFIFHRCPYPANKMTRLLIAVCPVLSTIELFRVGIVCRLNRGKCSDKIQLDKTPAGQWIDQEPILWYNRCRIELRKRMPLSIVEAGAKLIE